MSAADEYKYLVGLAWFVTGRGYAELGKSYAFQAMEIHDGFVVL